MPFALHFEREGAHSTLTLLRSKLQAGALQIYLNVQDDGRNENLSLLDGVGAGFQRDKTYHDVLLRHWNHHVRLCHSLHV